MQWMLDLLALSNLGLLVAFFIQWGKARLEQEARMRAEGRFGAIQIVGLYYVQSKQGSETIPGSVYLNLEAANRDGKLPLVIYDGHRSMKLVTKLKQGEYVQLDFSHAGEDVSPNPYLQQAPLDSSSRYLEIRLSR